MASLLVTGLLLGGLYAVVAIGLALAFGVLRLVNLAHGEFVVGGAFATSLLIAGTGMDPLVAALPVGLLLGLAAYAVQRTLFTPLMARGEEPAMVATFALSALIQSTLLLVFTSDPRVLNAAYATHGFRVGGVLIRTVLLIAGILGVVLVLALRRVLTSTRFGRDVRAAATDPEAAAAIGVNVPRVYGLTLAIAAATATLGGVLVALAFSVAPTSGTGWLLRAFTAVVLGGLGSIEGALVGGLIVGVAEVIGADLVGPQYRDVVVFGLLVVVLLVRPEGLFAPRRYA